MLSSFLTPVFSAIDIGYASLAIRGVYFLWNKSVPDEIVVESTGIGNTQPAAIENALNLAVQKGIGVLIVSEQSMNNDKIVRDLVAQYSAGTVNSFKVKKCEGQPVVCDITAKVSPSKFFNKLENDSAAIKLDGNNLYAKHVTLKNLLIQRHKITQYYMAEIRRSGIGAKITSVNIRPSMTDDVTLVIDYELIWNKNFKSEMIYFLQLLEKDNDKNNNQHQVYIQWDSSGIFDNRVRINAYTSEFKQMMEHYISQPTYVKFKELNVCEKVDTENIFAIDWRGMKYQKIVTVNSNQLRNIKSITTEIGC